MLGVTACPHSEVKKGRVLPFTLVKYDSFHCWLAPTLANYDSFHFGLVPTLAKDNSFHSSIVPTDKIL